MASQLLQEFLHWRSPSWVLFAYCKETQNWHMKPSYAHWHSKVLRCESEVTPCSVSLANCQSNCESLVKDLPVIWRLLSSQKWSSLEHCKPSANSFVLSMNTRFEIRSYYLCWMLSAGRLKQPQSGAEHWKGAWQQAWVQKPRGILCSQRIFSLGVYLSYETVCLRNINKA